MPDLMLQNRKVFTFREENGIVTAVGKPEGIELLPVFLQGDYSAEKVNEWFKKRGIPSEREGLPEMMKEFGSEWLSNKNRLSLSDQYWVKMRFEEWKKINFFDNRFSMDVGDIAFHPWSFHRKNINNHTPDLTTNGILRKRWKMDQNGSAILIKAGSKAMHQEPLSEVLVSVLLEQLDIMPFVRYDLWVEGTHLCSACRNFITKDTDLVPLSAIYYKKERKSGESIYDHILKMCDLFEVPGMKEYLDAMIFIDRITGNSDRNLGNIALIRDVKTLKFKGPAPLFDFGAAYWSAGKIENSVKSKSFGDVEQRVFKKMKKKCDVNAVLTDNRFADLIESYPRISEQRKRDLIEAIKKRNRSLLRGPEREYDDLER